MKLPARHRGVSPLHRPPRAGAAGDPAAGAVAAVGRDESSVAGFAKDLRLMIGNGEYGNLRR
jgi:hypothetical protein